MKVCRFHLHRFANRLGTCRFNIREPSQQSKKRVLGEDLVHDRALLSASLALQLGALRHPSWCPQFKETHALLGN